MHLDPSHLLGLAAAIGFALWLAIEVARRSFRRLVLDLRRSRASRGEDRADGMLRALGFDILGRQVPARYSVAVDGVLEEFCLRADYLVERDVKRFVAEVKTGRSAPRLETAATRRQLLEYRIAFDVDGVLLVDADAGTVREIAFPLPVPRPSSSPAGWLLVGAALGALGTWAFGALLR